MAFSRLTKLNEWISEPYVHALESGTLQRAFSSREPFPHVVLPKFFLPDVYQAVWRECEQAETSEVVTAGGQAVHHSFVRSPDLLRLLYGPALRRFLTALVGANLVRPGGDLSWTTLAQLRRLPPGSRRIKVHTDATAGFDLGLFIYLNTGWQPGCGGETCLYRRVGSLLLEDKVVEPVGNTLMVMSFSDVSFHAVREVRGDWTRTNIFLGWQTV